MRRVRTFSASTVSIVVATSFFWMLLFSIFSLKILSGSGDIIPRGLSGTQKSDGVASDAQLPSPSPLALHHCPSCPPLGKSCNPAGDVVDCGWGGITEQECLDKGCCWEPGAKAWCFHYNDPDPDDGPPPRPPPPFAPDGTPRKYPISIVMIESNTPRSLRHTLNTYLRRGLFDMVEETIVYIQEINDTKRAPFEKYPIRIIGSPKNTRVWGALHTLVHEAKQPIVLLLEKDFALLEQQRMIDWQLDAGVKLLQSQSADVVRYRHRFEEGDPNWAWILYHGHEDDVFKNQPNLLCNFFHWIRNMDQAYPDKVWRCSNDPLFYCSKSKYCNWTNNPSLFLRSWFVAHIDPLTQEDLDKGVGNHGLEHKMNWDPSVWNEANYTIAFGDGLFTHAEMDG